MHTETVEVNGGTLKAWDTAYVGGRQVVIAGVYIPAVPKTEKNPGEGAKVLVRRTGAELPEELRPVAVIDVQSTEHGHYAPAFVPRAELSLV